ncbi:MAG TPA: pyruvate formate lyase family protein, partial [Rhodothermales bacterium]
MIAEARETLQQAPVEEQLQARTSAIRPFEAELRFTDTYKRYRDAHPALREAMCLRAQAPDIFEPIEEGDLLAGRIRPRLVGFTPDEWGTCAFGYYHLPQRMRETMNRLDLTPQRRQQIEEMIRFWDLESTSAKLRRRFPEKMARYLPSDDWMNTYGIAFPLYRMTGGNVDYAKLLRLGIPGLRAEIEEKRQAVARDPETRTLYEGMLLALDVLVEICHSYAFQSRTLAKTAATEERAASYRAMADALTALPRRAPDSLREALQLFWLYSLIGDVRNHGRMDVYAGDFLARDLERGTLTEDEALALLQSLWTLMARRATRVHNRVIIGGKGRPNEANADRFALLAMEATRTVREAEPQLSLRFYEGQNPALYEKAMEVIGEGRTFPILYNDDVNIPSIVEAFGFTAEESEQYVPYGCGEYILDHQSFGTPSGVINLLKALEVTLRNGHDPMTGKPTGLALGRFEDFHDFEDLWQAYCRQVQHYVEIMADHEALAYQVAGEEAPFLFLSMLYDDCLARGKGIFSGGIRYLGGTLETYGNSSVADSLTAIKKLVYETRTLAPSQLIDALDADFVGYEHVRRLMLDAPKYGNDDAEADAMLLRVHDHVCNHTRNQAARLPLHSYLVVIINNSANALMGRWTAASADGRRACTPMNNGNAPSSGSDHCGATAVLNSVVKPSTRVHAGAVQNMKFSRELFVQNRPELEALLGTYFDNGGAQAMIT